MRVLLVLLVPELALSQAPQFSFEVFTDIQYGDQATAGKREYRKSLPKLRDAIEAVNARKDLAFAIQLCAGSA